MGWRARLKQEARDALEVVVLPGMAALLPWRFCYRLFRRMARWEWLYREACYADLHMAEAKNRVRDRQRWLQERRLVQLVDHADHYLHRTRSDAWMRKHLSVSGAWSEQGRPGFLFTLHWGAGMWGLRHAHMAGLKVHALSAFLSDEHFRGRSVLKCYVRARLRSVEQALLRPLVYVPKGLRNIRGALKQGEQVLALLDVPQDDARSTERFELLGEAVALSPAMAEMAVQKAVPYCIYLTGIDLDNGHRYLTIHSFPPAASADEIMQQVLVKLEEAISTAPSAWHLWGQWPRFQSKN